MTEVEQLTLFLNKAAEFMTQNSIEALRIRTLNAIWYLEIGESTIPQLKKVRVFARYGGLKKSVTITKSEFNNLEELVSLISTNKQTLKDRLKVLRQKYNAERKANMSEEKRQAIAAYQKAYREKRKKERSILGELTDKRH